MNPVLIKLGLIEIRWYSVLILVGFIIGYLLIIKRSKKLDLPVEIISDLCFYLIIVCIIGARLYFCLFNLDYYSKNILDIFKIWEGGLAIHGGIIAGLIFTYFYTKKKKLPFLKLLDIFAPSLILGQAIGRWGNFFNQEAFGTATTDLFLKSLKIVPKFVIDNMYIYSSVDKTFAYRQPMFYYESLWCILGFIIIIIIRKLYKNKKDGFLTSIYLMWYGIGRFLVEILREDALKFSLFGIKLKIAQIVSITMIVVGIILFIKCLVGSKNDKQEVGHNLRGRTKKRLL